jgi:DNA-dependent RNA polymerase auxiliary subunit epsilon
MLMDPLINGFTTLGIGGLMAGAVVYILYHLLTKYLPQQSMRHQGALERLIVANRQEMTEKRKEFLDSINNSRIEFLQSLSDQRQDFQKDMECFLVRFETIEKVMAQLVKSHDRLVREWNDRRPLK